MIRITRDGSRLFVGFSVEALNLSLTDDEKSKNGTLWFAMERGDAISAAAVLSLIQTALADRIKAIRREAYEQGAKDRALKARFFSSSLDTAPHSGGCYK